MAFHGDEFEEENSIEMSWVDINAATLRKLVEDIRARCDPKARDRILAIDLMENNLGSAGVAALCEAMADELSPVEELRLRYNNIGKGGADELGSLLRTATKIRVVDVRGNRLTSSDAHSLLKGASKSPTLVELILGGNDLGGQGAAKASATLQCNTVIGHLSIPSNSIGSDGAAELAVALRHPEVELRILDVANNAIGAAGAAAIFTALAEGNKRLTRLFIGQNPFGDGPLPALCEALFASRIVDLDLRSCGLTDRGLLVLHEGIASSSSLQRLSIAGNSVNGASVGFERFCSSCSHSDTLTAVDVANCAIGRDGAQHVSSLVINATALTELNLAFDEIDDIGANSLAKAIVQCVNGRLASIDLTGNAISDSGANLLLAAVQAAPNVSGLSLHGNPGCSRVLQTKLDKKLHERRMPVQTVF